MMTTIPRPFWLERLGKVWECVPVIWLSGVRRVGKTTLAEEIPGALLLNCDLPSTARRVQDPERFYASVDAPVVVFDEIHQLEDPSLVLKIGADEFSHLKILATGSSTLAATRKFRDSLTGRKRSLHLVPVLDRELESFGVADLRKRLFHGGLPEPLLATERDPEFFTEWLDSYFARDIQELFRVGKRHEFLKLVEFVLRSSGGLLDIARLAKHVGLSRPTVMSYLDVLEVTHVLLRIRPHHAGGRQELLRQPKIYGFDTGFTSFCRGWDPPHEEDYGLLWEHLVLETLLTQVGPRHIRYWRDKRKREVDFVVLGPGKRCDAVECKWDADRFSPRALQAFRGTHPEGQNFVISPQEGAPYLRGFDEMEVCFCNLRQWESGEANRHFGA